MSDYEPPVDESDFIDEKSRVGPSCFGWILIIGGAIWLLPYIIGLIPLAIVCAALYFLYKYLKRQI